MTGTRTRTSRLLAVLAVVAVVPYAPANDRPAAWNRSAAAAYLDEREKTWLVFANAARGAGDTKTTCVSCHTVVGFAFARPVLRRLAETPQPTELERKIIADRKKRVENWADLDSKKLRLFYDSSERKKKESWGTEAVLNALVLALDDRYQGRKSASAATQQAFTNLWQVQIRDGRHQGSWDWLDFDYEPWEAKNARYFGAALAAIAVGTAPGYYTPGADSPLDANVHRLRGYLQEQRAAQNLFNLTWLLWASRQLAGTLTESEQASIADQLLAKQQPDGGWSLASLGTFARRDGSEQETASDGYATGLVLHVLQVAGVSKSDARIAKGLAWLCANQSDTGGWRGVSLNKQRDPATHAGKFMSDAATAFAVLALSHSAEDKR